MPVWQVPIYGAAELFFNLRRKWPVGHNVYIMPSGMTIFSARRADARQDCRAYPAIFTGI